MGVGFDLIFDICGDVGVVVVVFVDVGFGLVF